VEEVRRLGGAGLSAFLESVERRLQRTVASAPGAVAQAGAETLHAGGKRLRPTLVFLATPVAARGSKGIEVAAAAVELVHMATLVHDDVLDEAPLRRGHPTAWATHGEAVAVATGDYLFARAFAELAALGDPASIRVLSQTAVELARGEVLQAAQARNPDVTAEAVLERCRLKTGRLFAAACSLGGRLGGLPAEGYAALDRFGESLGLAFQLADDVLDCAGDPTRTGKALGTDLRDGTTSLPLLLAAHADPALAAALRAPVAAADVLPLLARVAATGALEQVRDTAKRYARSAEAELERAPGSEATALRALLQRAIDRDS
jgi:geranylgeranyl pyrophosphate synthase